MARWFVPSGASLHGNWAGRRPTHRIAADDQKATSPGDVLRELFNEYGPCLILIDEWVAYARQLHDQGDLPAGSFETHFSFAQVLTESAKLAKNCLLVISLPASDDTGSPHTLADDAEVGGERGREALVRLRNVVDAWNPPGGRPPRKRASRSCVAGSSSRSATPRISRTGTSWPGPSPISTEPSSRSSHQSAGMRTTRSGSRPPIPSTPRSSIGCTPTGPRC